MDFNSTIDLIIKDLEEARKIIDDLKKYPGVPSLQVELAKSKCKSAGEIIAMLKEPDKELSPVSVEPVLPPVLKQPLIHPEKINITEVADSNTSDPEKEKKIVQGKKRLIQTEKAENKSHEIADLQPVHKTKKEEPGLKPGDLSDSRIVADNFSPPKSIYYEKLSSLKTDDDLSENLNAKPVTNLIEAIGLNDKFLMIREIFNGNNEDYNQAISRLNDVKSLADAKAVIMSYTGKDTETEAVTQLLDLVKRKLLTNE